MSVIHGDVFLSKSIGVPDASCFSTIAGSSSVTPVIPASLTMGEDDDDIVTSSVRFPETPEVLTASRRFKLTSRHSLVCCSLLALSEQRIMQVVLN